MLRRAAWQLLPGRAKEYIFKYIVKAREAKTLAMTKGWGLDVCSIARSISCYGWPTPANLVSSLVSVEALVDVR